MKKGERNEETRKQKERKESQHLRAGEARKKREAE